MKTLRSLSFILPLAIAGMLMSCKENAAPTKIETTASPADGEKVSTELIENQTTITFDRDTHNFGDIKQGDKVKTQFNFTNTGTHDLLITDAYGSCGCTVPEWPKEPIPPGGIGVINVQFDSKGKHGAVSKTVTVVANTVPNNTRLIIKGNIIE